MKNDEDLIKYLLKFISKERQNLFLNKIEERTKHLTIVLDNIYQSRNISACIRSAECFGIQDIHILEDINNFSDDREVSLGASKWTNIYHYKNNIELIKSLKKNKYKILATKPCNANYDISEINLTNKTAIIFGSEINGCSNEILKYADETVHIPMHGFTESLNVSVAVAISLHYLTNKMRNSNINWKLTKKLKNKILLNWLRKSIKSSKEIEKLFIKNN